MIAFAITHVIGLGGIAAGVVAFQHARGTYAEIKTEQRLGGARFKRPEAVAENQRRIKEITEKRGAS